MVESPILSDFYNIFRTFNIPDEIIGLILFKYGGLQSQSAKIIKKKNKSNF